MSSKYGKILYKISGEVLSGNKDFGYDIDVMKSIAKDIANVYSMGVKVCLVIGGGNICRGAKAELYGIDRIVGDNMGMIATVMNALAMQNIIEKYLGIETRVMSAIEIKKLCEFFIVRKAERHLEKGRVVIFTAGTGNPFFTTDTAATLRAVEMNCDIIVKGTSVDGVYSEDPKKNPNAKKYDKITFDEVVQKDLKFMDRSAIMMAKDHEIPIVVMSIRDEKSPLTKLVNGESISTLVTK